MDNTPINWRFFYIYQELLIAANFPPITTDIHELVNLELTPGNITTLVKACRKYNIDIDHPKLLAEREYNSTP